MNVQQRLDELMAHENVTVAGVVDEINVQHLSIVVAKTEYIWKVSDANHRIYKCNMIVYNRGEANEEAYYWEGMPGFLTQVRDTYHTDAQVKGYIENEYPGAEVISIRQSVVEDTDRIQVDAKWTDGYFYTVTYRAWASGDFAREQLTQM